MAYKDTAKQWFQIYDYPTEEQFGSTFEMLRWKDEPVVADDLSPELLAAINAGAAPLETIISTGEDIAYTIAIGYLLEKIITITSVPATPSCQYAAGAEGDIIPAHETGVTKDVWTVDILAVGTVEDILIVGVPAGGKVIILKRKIL